jgi:dipeptidyl aminopeptidase/acylaminoacyl peptidase
MTTRPYGTWPGAFTPQALAASLRLQDVQWDSDGDTLVWLEGRSGLGVLVAQRGADAPRDLTPPDMPVRARVGYGGGDFTAAGGHVYFAGPGGRLYRQPLAAGKARPITPAFGQAAAPRVSPDGRWLAFIHNDEDVDGVAVVDTGGAYWPAKLAYGTDFAMQPAWSPDGTRLAYIAWNHPQMPWDGTELRLLTLNYAPGRLPAAAADPITLAGDTETAVFQPEFSPDGRWLAYASDASGWWQLYVYDLDSGQHTQLTQAEAEHAVPAWVQGSRTFGWLPDSRALLALRNERGFYSLWRVAVPSGRATRIGALDAYTHLAQIAVSASGTAALLASSWAVPPRVVSVAPEDGPPPALAVSDDLPGARVLVSAPDEAVRIHRRAGDEAAPPEQLAAPEALTWTGHDGEAVHGLYYAPASDRFTSPGAPPLIVLAHGGPSGQVTAAYSGEAQFFATRGFAVLAVNYRGSTGYGKAYLNKLRGSWGVYDVEDCATGALFLAESGRADRDKLVIMGGSAGGFTVLQSLVDKPGFYRAGVCLYGVSNQFLLVQDTHKFEARYSDSLLGPLPEAAALYRARSPLLHADKIVDALAVFQGADDNVVPRNQSDLIVESLQARGVPHIYHVYEGEGHGWRKAETITAYYQAVTAFLIQHVVYA